MTIVLDLTQDQAVTILESITHERVHFGRFIDRQRARGTRASPESLARLGTLDYLIATLKTKTGY